MKHAITCTRRLTFCAGHRIKGHEGKCRHVHGHNYVVHVTASPVCGLDNVGRVVDFGVLKERVGGWIEKNFDHGFIYEATDIAVIDMLDGIDELDNIKHKRFAIERPPTAENIAAFLFEHICPRVLADCNVNVTRVVVEETENCSASYGND